MAIVKIVPMPGPSGDGTSDINFPIEGSNARTGTGEVLKFSDPGYQSIITGPLPTILNPTSQRLVVAGRDGLVDTTGEGGDLYLWAGRGGSAGGSGGDVKLDAGNGGGLDGSGGTVKMRGGYSQTSGGGFVQILAGDSGTGPGGNLELRAGTNYENEVETSIGGNVTILGGYSADPEAGGNIELTTYNYGKITLNGNGGEFLNNSTDPDNQIATIGDIQDANIADFVFTNVDANNSSMTITGDKEMTIESGATNDLNVRAGDQLWLTAGNDVILQADDTVQVRSLDGVEILSNYVDLGDAEHRWQFTQGAELILPGGGVIVNAPESSSDGGLLSTLILVPDGTNETNQFVVLDPTGPNHIHIRAGGPIDESTAELILGGERNKVVVSDSYKSVGITTAATITNIYVNAHEANSEDLMVPDASDILIGDNIVIAGINHPVTYFSPDPNNTGFSIVRATGVTFTAGLPYTFVREEPYENQWTFGSNGVLYGPAMGGLLVSAIANTGNGNDLYVYANDADVNIQANDGAVTIDAPEITLTSNAVPASVNINTYGGAVVNSYRTSTYAPEDKVVATLGDISATVGGTVRYSPTFAATGLAFTGSDTTYPTYNSYYTKVGNLVSFVIEVDLSTVTNFGTGQYKLQLPFTPAFGFNHFTGWAWADPNVSPDIGTGHTIINADTAGVTDVLDLHYLKSAGGANTPIREGLFVQGTPVTLSTISKIYINGTYIAAQ